MTAIADSVRQRIDVALSYKGHVVSSLMQAADSLTGQQRRELLRLRARVASAEGVEEVLSDARLLELFLALATTQTELAQTDDPTRQSVVDRQVLQVLQRQAQQSRAKHDRWAVLIYPLLTLLLSAMVFAFIAIAITPVFEQMFDEFGLTYPGPTRLVFSVSHFMQSVWFWAVFAGLLLLLMVILGMRTMDSLSWFVSGSAGSTVLTGYSTRRSLGDLAWHTALLLDIGQQVETSVAISAAASRKAAMRREAHNLARYFGLANPVPDQQHDLLLAPQPYAAATQYLGVPCHLLTDALHAHQDDQERSAMLREIANLYWDREQTKSIWMLSWLQPVAVLLISLAVGFVVLALFMPLVELITGLT